MLHPSQRDLKDTLLYEATVACRVLQTSRSTRAELQAASAQAKSHDCKVNMITFLVWCNCLRDRQLVLAPCQPHVRSPQAAATHLRLCSLRQGPFVHLGIRSFRRAVACCAESGAPQIGLYTSSEQQQRSIQVFVSHGSGDLQLKGCRGNLLVLVPSPDIRPR